MFQFNIVFGILVAFVSNALLAGIGENAWRWMLGVAAFPSLLYTAAVPRPPREPALAAEHARAIARPASHVLQLDRAGGVAQPRLRGGSR